MNSADRTNLGALLATVGAGYSKQITEALVDFYWQGLEDLRFEDINRAFRYLARTSEFMPTVAAVRKLIEKPKESPKLRAAAQWNNAVAWVRHSGRFYDHEGDDPITAKVVSAMGAQLRDMPCDGFDRSQAERRFIEAYVEIAITEDLRERLEGPEETKRLTCGGM